LASAVTELRRTPRQARSLQLVGEALDAADRLLAEGAGATLTTTTIAAEAGVSVGALYQYFPGLDAIVAAVALRHIEASDELMDEALAAVRAEGCADPVGMLVDLFAARYRAQPGYRALWSGPRLTERLREADRVGKARLADGVRTILLELGIADDDDRLAVACAAAVHACDALLQEAFRRNPDGDPEFLEQAKEMLRGHLGRIGRPSEARSER
jgi:AcrR family transcriptional regulator